MPAKPSLLKARFSNQPSTEGDAKFAKTKPANFIESGPLAELDRSGYIDRLYAGQDLKAR
jgi:hypothetical protein